MATVTFEIVEPRVGLITLNRPERMNAINAEWLADLHAIFDRLQDDRSVRAVIVTGAGRGFCAGYDLKDDYDLAGAPASEQLDLQERIAAIAERLMRMRQPVIAAINGPCAGGGLALALAADLRVAARSANFHVANARIGLSAGESGISWLFPRLVGLSRCMEVLLTGRPFDAEEADRMGLLSRLVDDAALMETALGIARAIAANPPFAMRMSKDVIYANLSAPDLRTAAAIENRTQLLCGATGEMAETVRAFREKRAPRYD